jgi:glycosyltransferase involved in cell wall biosynthesis
LVLVGDGPLRDELKRQAKELGLEDRILFAGEVTDVRPFLAAADLFALSSVAVETFSNAALEASAAGLPVVLTDIGGARELVDEGASGLVVPPRNPAALATALEDLLRDQARCARMGELGRARTVAAFGFGRMLAEWVSVLWDEGGVVASRPPQQVA